MGLPDIRACVVLSRDGLALGAFPESEERRAVDAWLDLAALGDVERGFVAVAEELWAFCVRGRYGAIALAGPAARPAVVLDRLDAMLLTTEGIRPPRDVVDEPEATEPRPEGAGDTLIELETSAAPAAPPVPVAAPAPAALPAPVPPSAPDRLLAAVDDEDEGPAPPPDPSDIGPVDTVALAREFAGLLTESDE